MGGKKLDIISFERNMLFRSLEIISKYVISFPRNHFEGTKYVIKCYVMYMLYVYVCICICVYDIS